MSLYRHTVKLLITTTAYVLKGQIRKYTLQGVYLEMFQQIFDVCSTSLYDSHSTYLHDLSMKNGALIEMSFSVPCPQKLVS